MPNNLEFIHTSVVYLNAICITSYLIKNLKNCISPIGAHTEPLTQNLSFGCIYYKYILCNLFIDIHVSSSHFEA